MLRKISKYFKKLPRKEVIFTAIDPSLHQIVFKYDYFLDSAAKIFLLKEDMVAMTSLPNGTKLIAYRCGKLTNLDKEYRYL